MGIWQWPKAGSRARLSDSDRFRGGRWRTHHSGVFDALAGAWWMPGNVIVRGDRPEQPQPIAADAIEGTILENQRRYIAGDLSQDELLASARQFALTAAERP